MLFETDSLQELVDVRQVHEDLARFGTLVAADDSMLGELVDDAAGARVADVELPLHQGDRRRALGGDGASRSREQRIQLALGGVASLPLCARAFLEDLLHVPRAALRAPEVHYRLDLRVA